jgi:hypothetical protein
MTDKSPKSHRKTYIKEKLFDEYKKNLIKWKNNKYEFNMLYNDQTYGCKSWEIDMEEFYNSILWAHKINNMLKNDNYHDIKVMTNIKLKLLNKTITADDIISLSENFLTDAPEKLKKNNQA